MSYILDQRSRANQHRSQLATALKQYDDTLMTPLEKPLHTFESRYLSLIIKMYEVCNALCNNKVDSERRFLESSEDDGLNENREIQDSTALVSMINNPSGVSGLRQSKDRNKIHAEEKLKHGLALSLSCSVVG